MGRSANLEEPKSIDEARSRLIDTNVQIDIFNESLAARFRYREEDGMPMPPEEHLAWKKRALAAKHFFMREAAICQQWIEGYEKDVRVEREVELREKTINIQRKNAEDRRARAEALRKRDAENNEWRNRMIAEHGTTKLPPDIARAEMIKLEQMRLEVKQAELDRVGTSHKRQEQKQRHREWLRRLEINDPVNELDPVSLLALAYRILRRLKEEGKLDFTSEEAALFSVIQERQLILNHIENDAS